MAKCNKAHEQRHVEQFESMCSGVCACQPAGRKAIGFDTDACKEKAECYGWATFFQCLKKTYETKFKKNTNTKCQGAKASCSVVLKALVQSGPSVFAKTFKCKEHGIDVNPK